MAYPIDEKLVIAIASSALFDLAESDRVFREEGLEPYRAYQREHEREPLAPGVAFPLVRRLLSLNGSTDDDKPVEVILLSRNDPDTGLRVFNSIAHHRLDVTRAVFVNGRNPFLYIEAFNASLFLSANPEDVRKAIVRGAPAGQVFPTDFIDNEGEHELRIAFDFDGVIADDSAEAVFKASGLSEFHRTEAASATTPMPPGPLNKFFKEVATLQQREFARRDADPSYEPRLRIAIVTARSAPAHERVVTTLREWGIEVDEVFFLGGIDKSRVLSVFRPHIFFDDQAPHIERAMDVVPSAHVPFGVANEEATPELIDEAIAENRARANSDAQAAADRDESEHGAANGS